VKIIFSIIFLCVAIFADTLKIGDQIDFNSIKNQFDKPLKIDSKTKKIIFALEKEVAESFVRFMDKNPKYLTQQKAVYIADIGMAPSFVKFLFIVPKLRRYDFSIGVMQGQDLKFKIPKKDKKLTIITLKNKKIIKIKFISKL
jgi:hypothetical protein